jgi:hypothetical protein
MVCVSHYSGACKLGKVAAKGVTRSLTAGGANPNRLRIAGSQVKLSRETAKPIFSMLLEQPVATVIF